MPGTDRTPFGATRTIFAEQPRIAAFISTETAQSIPDATDTIVTFATPVNDDPLGLGVWHLVWDPGTPGTFTVRHRGFYLVGAAVSWGSAVTGNMVILQNGVVVAVHDFVNAAFATITTMRPADAGDTFQLRVRQVSGGPVNLGTSGLTPNFWIIRAG